MDVIVMSRGELDQYIAFNKTILSFAPADNEKSITYVLRAPPSLERPGEHTAEIVAIELPRGSLENTQDTVVAASAGVISQLVVNVPYPGKYLKGDFFAPGGNVDEPVEFTVSLYNLGAEDLKTISGSLEILGPTNERIAKMDFNTISLASKQAGKIAARYAEHLNPGIYHAVARVDYDGKKLRFDQDFGIGNQYIDILRIGVDSFRLGEIVKFNIDLENEWNNDLQGVYGELSLLDQAGATLTSTKTASVDMPANERATIYAYLNTVGINPGRYILDLIVHYANHETRRRSEIDVSFDSVLFSSPTGKVVSSTFSGKNLIFMVLIGVLVAINLVWLIYFKRLLRPKSPTPPAQRQPVMPVMKSGEMSEASHYPVTPPLTPIS